jgi:YVTN family beta-propeller protein
LRDLDRGCDFAALGGQTGAAPVTFIDTATNAVRPQVWLTLKDTGRVMVFDARPPFTVLHSFAAGPITSHVNFVQNRNGSFAYVTVGGMNEVQVYRTGGFARVATIPVGPLPHGLWPSGDGTRIYVGLENGDAMVTIDTLSNRVLATTPIGQAPQAVNYVPNAVREGTGIQGLQPLGVAGEAAHLTLGPPGAAVGGTPPTSAARIRGGHGRASASTSPAAAPAPAADSRSTGCTRPDCAPSRCSPAR